MTQRSGAAATSVEMCAVTATSSPDGTAARNIQRPIARQLGAGVAARAPARRLLGGRGERSSRIRRRLRSMRTGPNSRRSTAEFGCAAKAPARAAPGRREAQGSCRHSRRRRENTDPCRPDGRCARTRPAATDCWPTAQRTAARSKPQTGREARASAHSLGGSPQPRAIDSGSVSPAATIRTMWTATAMTALGLHQEMRVGIAGEQHRLEKHHGDRPDRGRAAENRQHHAREHRLHGEKQERAGENGRREKAAAAMTVGWKRRGHCMIADMMIPSSCAFRHEYRPGRVGRAGDRSTKQSCENNASARTGAMRRR